MKADYPYIGMIILLIVMLVGNNIQYQRQIAVLQSELQAYEDLTSHMTMVLNSRISDLRTYIHRLEKERDYLTGLWEPKIPKDPKDPRGMKTMD